MIRTRFLQFHVTSHLPGANLMHCSNFVYRVFYLSCQLLAGRAVIFRKAFPESCAASLCTAQPSRRSEFSDTDVDELTAIQDSDSSEASIKRGEFDRSLPNAGATSTRDTMLICTRGSVFLEGSARCYTAVSYCTYGWWAPASPPSVSAFSRSPCSLDYKCN
jgi:hypothetical protein